MEIPTDAVLVKTIEVKRHASGLGPILKLCQYAENLEPNFVDGIKGYFSGQSVGITYTTNCGGLEVPSISV